MGGQTIRMLDYLLRTSIKDSSGVVEQSQLLGDIHTGWIKSITSLSTPHNGTTLSDIVTTGIPFYRILLLWVRCQEIHFIILIFNNGDLEKWTVNLGEIISDV